jgi:hypothetical protein
MNGERLASGRNALRELSRDFWVWYERNYTLNVAVATALFALQVVHLTWLTAEPLWTKLFGEPLLGVAGPARWPIVLVDYTEIPALLSVSLLYVDELRRGFAWRPVVFLTLLNSQWLHIFWITDAFVVQTNGDGDSRLPSWLAYCAIAIDYLEVPVLVDTVRRLVGALRADGSGALARDAGSGDGD